MAELATFEASRPWLTCDGCIWVSNDHTFCGAIPGGSETSETRRCESWRCAGCGLSFVEAPDLDHAECLSLNAFMAELCQV